MRYLQLVNTSRDCNGRCSCCVEVPVLYFALGSIEPIIGVAPAVIRSVASSVSPSQGDARGHRLGCPAAQNAEFDPPDRSQVHSCDSSDAVNGTSGNVDNPELGVSLF